VGLAGTRRAIEDHAPGWTDAELPVYEGQLERELDQLSHQNQLLAEASYILEPDIERALLGPGTRRFNLQLGFGGELGRRIDHLGDLVHGAGVGAVKAGVDLHALQTGRPAFGHELGEMLDEVVSPRDVDGRR